MKRFGLMSLSVLVGATVLMAAITGLPKPISSPLPNYPEAARQARATGTVDLWFKVGADGEVTQVGVISGNPLLREAAAATVKSWRFQPSAMSPGVRFETDFVYSLNVQQQEGEPRLTVSMRDFRRVEIVSELYVTPTE